MLKLLTKVSWFGNNLNWDADVTKVCLIAIQAILVVLFVALILYLILRRRNKEVVEETVVTEAQPVAQTNTEVVHVQETKPTEIRTLKGITLDLGVVQREFVLDEGFNCAGLVVNAEYNLEPKTESIVEYRTVDVDFYNRLGRDEKENTCYVIKPDVSQVGKKVVYVRYGKHAAAYTVDVREAVDQLPLDTAAQIDYYDDTSDDVEQTVVVHNEPLIVEEDSFDGRLRYDKSFTARLIQSEDEVKYWYTDIKNELLSYKKVKDRTSWKRETFKCGGKLVLAKLAFRGKMLCIFLPLNPTDYSEEYHAEDASDMSCYEDTPLMIRIKNKKRLKYAIQLISTVMEQNNILRVEREPVDYYVPYQGTLELIKQGLIKREIKTAEDEAIFEQDKLEKYEDDTFELKQVAHGVYVTKKDTNKKDKKKR